MAWDIVDAPPLPEDCSEDIFPAFPGTKVHGIHFEHEARPSVAINLITGLNDYLKSAQGLPKTVQELQAEVVRMGCRAGSGARAGRDQDHPDDFGRPR